MATRGVFTEYIHDRYRLKMKENQEKYERIMKDILQTQLGFDTIKQKVDEFLQDEYVYRHKSNVFYLHVDVGELFKNAGGFWVYNKDKKIIDFNISRNSIRTLTPTVDLYENFFQNCPILQAWIHEYLSVWFDGCKIYSPHCRWYESSGNLEVWIPIDIINPAIC